MKFTILFFAAAAISAFAGAAAACGDYVEAKNSIEVRDYATAEALYAKIDLDPNCSDEIRLWVGESLAREAHRAALYDAETLGEREAFLRKSIGFSEHWRVYVDLADIARSRGDRDEEATLLQQAINRLNDGPQHHVAEVTEIAGLHRRATNAMLLADTAVAIPSTRSGEAGGVLSAKIRGFEVSEVELPITFDFNSAALNAKGLEYASRLLDHLLSVGARKAVLEGHTDPVGSEVYNLDLSMRRAAEVKRFLIEGGFTGEIVVDGRGESEPPVLPQDIAIGSEEHHQLARRVVLVRG